MIANDVYRDTLAALVEAKSTVSPRGYGTREYLAYHTRVDMSHPIITIPARKLNYRFMVAEAYWILTGQSALQELTPYCERMRDFSDDGINLSGAYGPKFVSQARYVVDALTGDKDTRQAVMTIWERNPRPSKDIPCTVSLQWLLRDKTLHCIANMRSSDIWLGWPYDVFTFTMMSSYILLSSPYRKQFTLGELHIIAGSQHLYDRDSEKAAWVGNSDDAEDGKIKAISLHGLNTPDDLLNVLGDIRNAPNDQVLSRLQGELCHAPV